MYIACLNEYIKLFPFIYHIVKIIIYLFMLHLLNKKASVSWYMLVGHMTSSQNESDLSKYLMMRK
jgi:hypothetical protein